MRFSFDYTILDFNMTKWKRLLDKQLTAELKICGQFWIEAAIGRIPVWEGASRGTFLKLASKIGYNMSVSGPSVSKGVGQSSGSIAVFGGSYRLIYTTRLWHLVYNECNDGNANKVAAKVFYRLITPGPYNFQLAANKEFELAAKGVRMPTIRPALRYIKRKV
jgi:hypothetical protein